MVELRQASLDDPSLDPPGITLGWYLTQLGKTGPALATMSEAVRLAPMDLRARLGLATWLLKHERLDEARRWRALGPEGRIEYPTDLRTCRSPE